MAKTTTLGTVAILALTGGIAYRSGQPPTPRSVPSPDSGTTIINQNNLPARAVSQPGFRAEGPCQVIRDVLAHEDLDPKEKIVSGHVAVKDEKGKNLDISFSGSQADKVDERTGCGEGRLAYMIALVSDPVNSHLALAFDRTVESVQRAVMASGYSYSNYYFPWDTNLSRDQPDLEKRREQKEEKQRVEKWPGLLLFRKKAHPIATTDVCGNLYEFSHLAVFLVSETPSAGINRIEFQRAVSYIPPASSCPTPIVGPTYSGSVDSLIDAIQGTGRVFRVFNGSSTEGYKQASDGEPVESGPLERLYAALQTPDGQPGLFSFIHPDWLSFHELSVKLSAIWPESMVAILSEDDTSFGGQARKFGVRTILFPREISRLRNATQPLAPMDGGASPGAQRRQLLPLDLRENSGRDSVLEFSDQTPTTQEAVIRNIGHELHDERYRFIGILASDPLDEIFLSRLVRDLRPDARMFLLDADMLFVRAAADSPLDGMLSATTYPLFLANQRWTKPPPFDKDRPGAPPNYGTIIAFPSRTAEAIYNATVAALVDSFSKHDPRRRTVQLVEYIPPFSKCAHADQPSCYHAPLWITVLGRGGYWPVAMLEKYRDDGQSNLFSWSSRPSMAAGMIFSRPDQAWTFIFVITSGLALLYASLVIWVHLKSSSNIWLWLESFWINPEESCRAGRAAYLSAKTLVILTAYAILAAPSWRLYWGQRDQFAAGVFITSLATELALLVAVAVPFRSMWPIVKSLSRSEKQKILRENFHVCLTPFAFIFAGGFIAAWSWIVFRDGQNEEPRFMVWRSLNLLSGVSPLLPMLFVAAAVLWWAWMHFRRLVLFSTRTPPLPNISKGGMEFTFDVLAERVKRAIGQPFFQWQRVGLAILVFSVIVLDPAKLLRTIEGSFYDSVYHVMLGLVGCLIVLTFTRMLVVWERLKRFLEQLERHPLREAFSAMPRDRVWSPIMQHGPMRRTYLFEIRSLETAMKIRDLDPPDPDWDADVDGLERDLPAKMGRIAQGERLASAESHNTYRHIQCMAEKLVSSRLAEMWKQGSSETLAGIEERIEAKATDRPKQLSDSDKEKKVAAEYVALPYLFFIRVNLLQIHNLLFFVVGGFVLAVFSMASYPFQSPRVLGWCMTVTAAVLGYGVARMFAQISKDSILSRITETEPGKLDSAFYMKLAAAGALPVISLITSQFPSVSRFLLSWLQPTLESLK
jgi:hypothetical protein